MNCLVWSMKYLGSIADNHLKKTFQLYNMTYNEKKSLYESIMKNVAKTVKRKLNESLATQKYDINIYIESSDCLISITEKDVVTLRRH